MSGRLLAEITIHDGRRGRSAAPATPGGRL